MGFFDKLFGGKHDAAPKFAGEKMTVMAPIDGTVIPLVTDVCPERHIGTHAHFPAHIGHQGPHEAIPGSHRHSGARLRH